MNLKIAMLGVTSLAVLGGFAVAGIAAAQAPTADVLIQGGTIYDGSAGNRGYAGDVVLSGDKIVYVGPKAPMGARRTINAKGMVVAPGFIDTHTHPDHFLDSTDPKSRQLPAWLTQGVTTIFVGVDGSGVPEVADRFAKLKQQGVGTNVAAYVGFGAIRSRVIGQEDRAPTAAELASEKALVAKGMCEGALGLSTGLFYVPQSYSKTPEVIELAKEAAKRGGIYDTHTRDYSTFTVGYMNSYREALQIGREAGLPVNLAHIKTIGADTWGKAGDVIKLVNDARAAGQKVSADQYPYIANGTSISAMILPNWALDGGYSALIKRLNDPATLEKIKADMESNLKRTGGAHSFLFRGRNQPWSGKYLDEVAKEWKLSPVDAAIRIVRQTERQPLIGFVMSPGDLANFMKQPWTVTASDGGEGHPREWGTYSTKYQEFVVKKKVISLGFFIRNSTGQTADIFGIKQRGYLRPGYFADVVVFNPKTYGPKNDFTNYDIPSDGVVSLFVNGKARSRVEDDTGAVRHAAAPHTATGDMQLRKNSVRGCKH